MITLFKKSKKYPRHIAIILDGNRRWAKKRGLFPWKGHEAGYRNVNRLMDWIAEFNIKEVTLFCFSLQNFQRHKLEVKFLMKLFETAFLNTLKDIRIKKYQTKINFYGQLELLPKKVQAAIRELEVTTAKYNSRIVNFCLAYGGQEEIVDAVNKLITHNPQPTTITREMIEENLQIKSSPDIIIRTSGEYRTSNFLCWQQAYSEWFFVKKYWPDFTKTDLIKIIQGYQNRERRFGK